MKGAKAGGRKAARARGGGSVLHLPVMVSEELMKKVVTQPR